MFWIGIGAYITEVAKTIPKAPVSIANCTWNVTTVVSTLNLTSSTLAPSTLSTLSSMATNATTVAVATTTEHE